MFVRSFVRLCSLCGPAFAALAAADSTTLAYPGSGRSRRRTKVREFGVLDVVVQ